LIRTDNQRSIALAERLGATLDCKIVFMGGRDAAVRASA
jgi:hypothetical protein